MRILKNYAFSLTLITGVVLGGLFGAIFGERTEIVKPIGDLFLNMMFVLIVPLVFFSVSSAICNMRQGGHVVGRLIASIIGVFLFTATIAAVMAYVVSSFYNPFEGLSKADLAFDTLMTSDASALSTGDMFVNTLTVSDFILLFSKNNLLPLIIFSIFFGIATSMAGESGLRVSKVLNSASEVILKMMGVIMYAAPIGLGCYFAYTVGQLGGNCLMDIYMHFYYILY